MQEAPAWVKEKLNTLRAEEGLAPIENPNYGYWAPVVRKIRNGLYRMYYCIVVNDNIDGENSWGERAFIGLMETADPASNQWEDKGYVICSSSDKGMNDYGRPSASDWNAYFKYNAIDPTLVITSDNRHWLTYGSWHSGFATIELNPETGKTMNELPSPWAIQDNSYGALVATRGDSNNRWQASEGPDVVYRDGYYYMFIAYGQLEVAYNTRVVRSVNPEGPYVDMLGNSATSGQDMYPEVTAPYKFAGSEGWVGISHCGIFDDGNGNWFYASQGRFPVNVGGNQYSNAIMMGHIRSIRWTEDGWPVVMPERYGAVPKVAITQSELVGEWELIQFNEFLNHQIAKNIIVVEVENMLEDSVFDTLREQYPNVFISPRIEQYHRYKGKEDNIVVLKLISETPKPRDGHSSILEKLLVDLFSNKFTGRLIERSEYPAIFEDAFCKYYLDESKMFRYARRRNVESQIKEFMKGNANTVRN